MLKRGGVPVKFSIIVPVYNTAQYLDTCIASVKNQKFSNWELIAIDDGSSDGSGKLLDRYAAEDNRIRVFHQNNRGQFYARQKGIEMAEGDYLLFLDSDDQLTTDSMEMIQETVHKKNPDIVLYPGKVMERGVDTQRRIGYISSQEQDVSVQWIRQQLISSNNMNSLFLKAFRRNLFDGDQMDYSAFAGKSYGEDKVRLLYPFSIARSVFYIPYPLYLYNHRDDSTMHLLKLEESPRLIANDMFSMLYSYMQLWGMDGRSERKAIAIYYLKNYLSVYFGLRRRCNTAQERKELRNVQWHRIVNKKAFRYFFSIQLGIRDKVKLLIAVMRL